MERLYGKIYKVRKIVIAILFVLQIQSGIAKPQSYDWYSGFMKIIPCESTLADVKVLIPDARLMTSKEKNKNEVLDDDYGYFTNAGQLVVTVGSDNDCSEQRTGNSNSLIDDTIIQTSFYPKNKYFPQDISLEYTTRIEPKVSDNGTILFEDTRRGMTITIERVKKKPKIISIERYLPFIPTIDPSS